MGPNDGNAGLADPGDGGGSSSRHAHTVRPPTAHQSEYSTSYLRGSAWVIRSPQGESSRPMDENLWQVCGERRWDPIRGL